MQDIDSLRSRLAREEEELETARREIDVAHHRIEGLRTHTDSLEKRIKLLREYVDLVESGGSDPGIASLLDAPAAPAAPSAPAAGVANPDLELGAGLPTVSSVEPALTDFTNVPPPAPAPARTQERPVSFDEEIAERVLADEILPRAEGFEEALLFLMAHHRRRMTPSSIIKAFRNLDYAPEMATRESIIAQMEQRPAYFAHAGKDGFVLTKEGREEAELLLSQLAF